MVLSEKDEKILASFYYDSKNPAAYTSETTFYKWLKHNSDVDFKRKDVRNWMSKQETITVHKEAHDFKRSPIILDRPNQIWDIDLADMGTYKKENDKFTFILGVIDIYRRYVYVRKLRNKSAKEVVEAFTDIITKSGIKPSITRSDQGKEFLNKHFQAYLKSVGIKHIATYSEKKGEPFIIYIFCFHISLFIFYIF